MSASPVRIALRREMSSALRPTASNPFNIHSRQHAPLPAAGHACCEIRIVARFKVQCFSVHDQHGYASVRQDF